MEVMQNIPKILIYISKPTNNNNNPLNITSNYYYYFLLLNLLVFFIFDVKYFLKTLLFYKKR